MRKRRLIASACVLALLCAAVALSLADAVSGGPILSKEQLNQAGMKIGVSTGSASMLIAEKELPNAEIVYYNDTASAYEAVAQGKLDAYVYDRRQMELAISSGRSGVRLLDENMDETVPIAVGISPVTKIPDFTERLNAFIRELKNDGTLGGMFQRWAVDQNEQMPVIPSTADPQIHLTVATSGVVPPFSYYKGADLNGYDIELAYRFAAWLGADVTFKVYDYTGIVPAAISGDVDCIMANLNITDERRESLPFSDVLYTEQVGIMVADTAAAASGSFWDSFRESFTKTFIRESRWQLFLQGILNTLIITVLSVLCGTLLGFGVFMLCRNGNPVSNAVTRFVTWLVQGMPMVVLLMILYYIVFGNVSISGILVSVIGFTLTFASSVFSLLKLGVGTVDRGQYEAAYALGYPNRRTFFRAILPQALPHILPAWKGEIVNLIKATAIVGYIAVQDLTKMADIVRSRTFEAFFPLIAITVIYFILEELIGLLISRISININPKRRSPESILKGVKTDD